MALDKDVLGAALYNNEQQFNNKTADELGDIEDARLLFWQIQADTIINHFKLSGQIAVTVATTGTASAQSGTGTGTIS